MADGVAGPDWRGKVDTVEVAAGQKPLAGGRGATVGQAEPRVSFAASCGNARVVAHAAGAFAFDASGLSGTGVS